MSSGRHGSEYKPWFRRGLEIMYAALRYQLTPEEYRQYRLYRRDRTLADIGRYLSRWTYENCYLPRMNPERLAPMLLDKWLFYLYYGGKGLPLPKVYGVFGPDRDGPGQITDMAGLAAMLMEKKPEALEIRPLVGPGKSLVIDQVRYGSQPMLVQENGKRMTVAELGLLLQGGEWLLQERVQQHSFLQGINPHSPNILTIVTFVNVDDSVELHFAVLRLGLKETTLAHRNSEIVVSVDPQTGKLGKGIYQNTHQGLVTSIHPNTLKVFTGTVLPQWNQIVAVCKAAALAMPQMRAVGWDVALTPRGPVLLDGNRDWDIEMMQDQSDGYLQPGVLAKLNVCGMGFDPSFKLAFFRDIMRKQRV